MPGVKVPNSQLADLDANGEPVRGTPLTVDNVTLGVMVPLRFYDNQGRPHTEVAFMMNGQLYRDPSGEEWASKLKVFSSKIAEQAMAAVHAAKREEIRKILEELGVKTSPVLGRMADVDVLADEVDEEVQKTAK